MSKRTKISPFKAARVADDIAVRHVVDLDEFADVQSAVEHLMTTLETRSRSLKSDMRMLATLYEPTSETAGDDDERAAISNGNAAG